MKLFFIAGSQRTGTTLLRLVLEMHSEVYCVDETLAYKLLPTLDAVDTQDRLSAFDRPLVGFKIPRFTEQLLEPTMSDPNYGSFPNFYRGEPVVFLFRDVRDVVVSMQSLRTPSGATWLEDYGVPTLRFRAESAEFQQRYKRELELLERWHNPAHAVAALYWRFKSDAFFDYLASGLPVLPLRYEELVADPRTKIGVVTEYLGLAWEDALLEHDRAVHDQLNERGRAMGNTDPSRRIDRQAVGRHRNVLTETELRQIDEIAGDTMRRVDQVTG